MFAERMAEIPFSGIRDIFETCNRLENEGRDVVHLEIGRPDFDTPEPIKEAAMRALAEGEVHYTSNYGIRPLRSQIATKYRELYGLEYDADSGIVVTAGGTEAVLVTVLALVDPGDEVLIPDPCWTYEPSIRMAGGKPVRYTLDAETGFQPDVKSLREGVSAETSLLIVNSPHNPTGSVLTEDSVDKLAQFATEHDLFVLSDEIYERITYGDTHVPLATADGMHERTITVSGLSKAYSMTGWRLGYLAAPPELVDPIVRARQYTSTCANSFAQHGGVRAVQGGDELAGPLVDTFAERRDALVDRLDAIPGMTCPDPTGAFYAMPTTPDGVTDETAFADALLTDAGVATVPGPVFGSRAEGRIRIAYTVPVERIHEAFDRVEAWLRDD
ncbi:pyridoxal phosphate-dependent aminotransferase [Salinigranum halophilum]|jgi:aspartate aminotransferase/aminotransferase|uniref:pyridoxal phosphate-dependent aminotransferase n=1 Tax=Salinigranum halophilum TaxID=2565931 RepID=UPI00191C2665|nr:pyridoxal phosphate-dependent aminotransferase [Salinigranum halophilum]